MSSSPESYSDILNVRGIDMVAKSFRACVFILDELLSCYDCHQFLTPVPSAATVYHKEIVTPMDFNTLEFNLYNNRYKEFYEFIIDLNLIWDNAKQFHRSFDPIFQQADNLHKRFQNIVTFLDGGERPFYISSAMNDVDMVTDTLIPEEKMFEVPFPMYKEVELKRKTNLYFVQALQANDPLIKKMRGFSNVRVLFQNLNSSFFHHIDTNSTDNYVLPLPRFYIAKNRTLLQQARVDPDGLLAVLCNVHFTHINDEITQVSSTVIHCEPMDETHNFDQNSMDKSDKYEYCPKAWLKLKIIRVVRDVVSVIDSDIDKTFFRKAYNTFKLSSKVPTDSKKVGNQELAKEFAQSILEPNHRYYETTRQAPATPVAKPKVEKGKQVQKRSSPSRNKSASLSIQKESSPNATFDIDSRSVSPTQHATSSESSKNYIRIPASESSNKPKYPTHKKTPSPQIEQAEMEQEAETDFDYAREHNLSMFFDQLLGTSQEDEASRSDRSESPQATEKPTSEPSNKPLTVRLLVKPNPEKTPTPSANNRSSSSESTESSGKTPIEQAIKTRSIPAVVPHKESSESDDETASYEYSDSDESDNHYSRPSIATRSRFLKDTEKAKVTSVICSLDPSAMEEGSARYPGIRREDTDDSLSDLIVKSERRPSDINTVVLGDPDVVNRQWKKVLTFAREKSVPVININDYHEYKSTLPNAEGYFKHVFYAPYDRTKVIQTFKRMSLTQRTTEVVGLITLKGKPHIGQITEVLQEGEDGEIIGLCMQRYEKTLKHYTHAHSHHRLTAYQKMDLVIQMLESIKTIHEAGVAHRDLSEVNFMVNTTKEKLQDGSLKAELYLIDFGKSVFVNTEDYKRWWAVQPGSTENIPTTEEELKFWLEKLPWVQSKPDHGYKLYRSIQTLPKNRLDTDVLPWLIHPMAEDLYSIGTLIWKTFAETEPWYGMLDTDLKGLRELVRDDYSIEKALQREIHGDLSRQLLLKFLRVEPLQRESAASVLTWINNVHIQNGLIREWENNAPVGRQKRQAKALYRYDEEQAQTTGTLRKKKKN